MLGKLSAQEEKPAEAAAPAIEFESKLFDFGTHEYDTECVCEFKFKNTGNAPLILSNVTASCGCTSPEWTKVPVAPGETGIIKVKYDSRRMGAFTKSITVNSNAGNPISLTITGNIQKTTEPK